jgi:hypothetical protein
VTTRRSIQSAIPKTTKQMGFGGLMIPNRQEEDIKIIKSGEGHLLEENPNFELDQLTNQYPLSVKNPRGLPPTGS